MEDEPVENTVSVDTVEEPVPTSSTVTISSTDEEDDTMDYFQKLADDSQSFETLSKKLERVFILLHLLTQA